jgi:hypothetical protein
VPHGRARFIPPSREQMQAFFKSQEGSTNAERGWVIGAASGKILKNAGNYENERA